MQKSGTRKITLLALAMLCLTPIGCDGLDADGHHDGKKVTRKVDFQKIIATAKSKVYPALVFVKPVQESFEGGERERIEVLGSGVIIDPAGYVVTNNHVAENAIEVNCVLGDKEQVPAEVLGVDPETDLALLKLKLPPGHPPLAAAVLGDSDLVKEGQFVMALGAPFGFTRSISLGIISNTKRYLGFESEHKYNVWFQTDATINPGNSGGPLVNTRGEVIGINTLGTWTGSIGFSIPSNVVRMIIGRLRKRAEMLDKATRPVKIVRAYTGLELQALHDFNSNTFTDSKHGVLLRSVDPNSPAAAAGLKDGDVLLKINDQMIDGAYVEQLPALAVLLADLPTDKPASMVVARRGVDSPGSGIDAKVRLGLGGRGTVKLSVKPVIRGKFEGEDLDLKRWNMTIKEISKFSNPVLHFLHPAGGVFVQGTRYSGNASDAGLSSHDILLKIDGKPVKTTEDAKAIYDKILADKTRIEKKILIEFKRGRFVRWTVLDYTKDYLEEE